MGHGDICKCDQLRADLARVTEERDEARSKVSELNRRCQSAESGLSHALDGAGTRTLGRALANSAASMWKTRADAAEKENAEATRALRETMEGFREKMRQASEAENERDEARIKEGLCHEDAMEWRRKCEAAERERDDAREDVAHEHEGHRLAVDEINETRACLAEVEAQAAAIRKKMLEFATMYRDVPSDYVRIWIEESSADAGRALLAELKDLRKENEQLEADIERCHSTTLGDERRAMWKELQALRLVRDAAEEVVAMSEPGMPTLRDVAVDALRAALDEAKEAGT